MGEGREESDKMTQSLFLLLFWDFFIFYRHMHIGTNMSLRRGRDLVSVGDQNRWLVIDFYNLAAIEICQWKDIHPQPTHAHLKLPLFHRNR